jgi:hypothetical protein
MMTTMQRAGGLKGLDPAVAKWTTDAATNHAAQTKKQKADRLRVRMKVYDMDKKLKEAIEAEAKRRDTSASQMAAFLLAYAIHHLPELKAEITAGLSASNTMKFGFNLDAPESWLIPANGDVQRGQ